MPDNRMCERQPGFVRALLFFNVSELGKRYRMEKPLMPSYRRLSVAFVRGQGAWLWDDQERRYLDAVSGIAVCGLGHAHPAVAQAVAGAIRTMVVRGAPAIGITAAYGVVLAACKAYANERKGWRQAAWYARARRRSGRRSKPSQVSNDSMPTRPRKR